MTISYSLAPVPKWYIADLVGKPLAGGYLATFSSLDHTALNPVFTDPVGNYPWTYVSIPNVGKLGILFDENGAQGPFYFKFNTDFPEVQYYLEVYDSKGILQWTIDDFEGGGGGGGSIITSVANLDNFVINNVMWRNSSDNKNPATAIIPGLFYKIAPSCHAGLAQTLSNAGPDTVFLKNNTTATDSISFPYFALGTQPLAGDVAPVQYLNYTCSVAGNSETQKCVQFPITSKVQNLTNIATTVTIWARSTSGNNQLLLQWRSFYGDGGGSADDIIPIQTLTLSNTWQKFVLQTTVPDISGKTLGACGNDGLFLQIQYPFGATTSIDFTKPSLYLGNIAPAADFMLNDQIDGILNVPRTGAIRTTMNGGADLGWLLMNDGTIGSASSNATSRANIDTFPLFSLIWNAVSNTYAPLLNSSGTPVARGVTASADFTANNQMSLTKSLGRALANAGMPSSGGTGTSWVVGQFIGEETHQLTIAEMPSHNHPGSTISGKDQDGSAGQFVRSGPVQDHTLALTIAAQGGDVAHNTVQPTQYQNFQIKL